MSTDVTRSSADPTHTAVFIPNSDTHTAPPSGTAVPDPPPGFTLDREIGSGGMGVVYLARQQGLNRPVALKTVRVGMTLDPRALIRFLAEAEAVAAVRHPHVVEVYAFGEHAGRPYLALEYCPGGDLTTVTKAEQTRDAGWFRRVAELMARIADGVNAAHALGIVHRDLKPANVLLTADGTPKVTDFGLAKRGLGSDLTHTTDVLGTPAYMAPEQASGRTKFVGPEADVWALGVILYELCCGQRPFEGPTPLEVMAAVARADVPKLRDHSPTVPTDLALVTHKCLSADPRDRYPTAGALATDLRNWLDGKPVSARPAGVVESAVKWVKRNKRVALTGLAVLLVMATATAVSLGFGLDATEQRKKAETEKQAAIDARDELAKANEKTERTLARSLFERFGTEGRLMEFGGRGEFDSHWQLVAARGSRLAELFVEEASLEFWGGRTKLLLDEEMLHAAVGLDSRLRARVDDLFAARLRDPTRSVELRGRLAALAAGNGYRQETPAELRAAIIAGYRAARAEWEPRSDELWMSLFTQGGEAVLGTDGATELANFMTADLGNTNSGRVLHTNHAERVAALCRLLPLERRVAIGETFLERLISQYERTNDFGRVHADSGRGMTELLRHLTRDQAERYAARLVDSCFVTTRYSRLPVIRFRGELTRLLEFLPRDRAEKVVEQLVQDMLSESATASPNLRDNLLVYSALNSWLRPEQTTAMRDWFLKKARQGGIGKLELHQAATLIAVSRVLPPEQAEGLLREPFDRFTDPAAHAALTDEIALIVGPSGDWQVAFDQAIRLADTSDFWGIDLSEITPDFESVCSGLTRVELHRRRGLPALVGGVVTGSFAKPKPLPPQALVDLLKRPLVLSEKRRAVLNALEITYDRRFKDLWEFVAFAEAEHPELDLLTPPKRPTK